MTIRLEVGPPDPRHSKKRKSSAAQEQEVDERLAEECFHAGLHAGVKRPCWPGSVKPGLVRPGSGPWRPPRRSRRSGS